MSRKPQISFEDGKMLSVSIIPEMLENYLKYISPNFEYISNRILRQFTLLNKFLISKFRSDL